MKKLLLTDLDDTLLTSDKKISPGNQAAIARWIAAGHAFSICTGRSLTGGLRVTNELGLEGQECYLICYQGNVIYNLKTKKVVYEHFMDADTAVDLMKRLQEEEIYAHTYHEGELLVPGITEQLAFYENFTGDRYRVFSDLEELRQEHLYKVISIDLHHPQRLQAFADANKAYLDERFHYFFSSPYFLEYIAKDSGKGVGALKLADILGVRHEDVIACGDERNDISMIEAAGIGVCMANGHADVKAVADYITTLDNNHDGIAEVIDRFIS